jgi:hypothetical protein
MAMGIRSGPASVRSPESLFEVRFPCRPPQLITHFRHNALQIVRGYTKPPSQDANLAGVSQVNLVANGLRLCVTHCVSLDAD